MKARAAMRWSRTSLETVAPDIARGLRAALVTLVPFYLAASLHRSELSFMALGGWFGTLVDPGGSRATRARTLLVFAVMGAVVVAPAEMTGQPPWLATMALSLTAFVMSLVRALGGAAAVTGNLVTMTVAIAAARPPVHPLRDAAFFGAGALVALVVSSIVWPVWTHLPVRRAVAGAYGELAAYIDVLRQAIADRVPADDPRWSSLVREHHRRIRTAIEAARDMAVAARARRLGETRFGGDVRALLGATEIQFPLLSALAVEVEAAPADVRHDVAQRLAGVAASCRAVERILVARLIGVPLAMAEPTPPPPSISPDLPAASAPLVAVLAGRLSRAGDAALDLALGLSDPAPDTSPRRSLPPPSLRPAGGANMLLRARSAVVASARTLVEALSPGSTFFDHALRTAIAAAAASVVAAWAAPRRPYWVTLAALAILQPYPGATMKRASERVVGTIFGSALALVVMVSVRSPLGLAALMVPMSVAAVATRPRSYRWFTFFLTPVFVLLAERYTGDWWTAATRVGDTILGGAAALVVGVFVIPSSELRRLPDALDRALDAVAAYAALVLGSLVDRAAGSEERVAAGRRASGIALGGVETSLERFLAEPLHDRALAADAMLLATYVRRLATAVTAVSLAASEAGASLREASTIEQAVAYVGAALATAKTAPRAGAPRPSPPPPLPGDDRPLDHAIERVVGWATLVAGAAEAAAARKVA